MDLIIYTTIDSRIQNALENAFNEVLLSEENGLQKILIILFLKKKIFTMID